jgi:hypothetical protein
MPALRVLACGLVGLLLSHTASAKILFQDDFEGDTLGGEPKKWQIVDKPGGDPPGEVAKDPDDPANKTLITSLRGDRNGRIYVAGDKNWADIVVRFDWYLSKEGNQHGTVFRYTDRNAHYLFDRRSPGAGNSLDFWRRQGGWTNFARAPLQTDVKTWYTVLLTLKGDTFSAKMKKKSDSKPFSKLEAILTGKDGAFKSGYFGTYGSEETGVAYYDNVIVGESEDEVEAAALAVRPAGKLAATWAQMKRLP